MLLGTLSQFVLFSYTLGVSLELPCGARCRCQTPQRPYQHAAAPNPVQLQPLPGSACTQASDLTRLVWPESA